jgi:hypothetical protein
MDVVCACLFAETLAYFVCNPYYIDFVFAHLNKAVLLMPVHLLSCVCLCVCVHARVCVYMYVMGGGNTKYWNEDQLQCPIFQPKILHRQVWDSDHISAVRGRKPREPWHGPL